MKNQMFILALGLGLLGLSSSSLVSAEPQSPSAEISFAPPVEHVTTVRIINQVLATDETIGVTQAPRLSQVLQYVMQTFAQKDESMGPSDLMIGWRYSSLYRGSPDEERVQARLDLIDHLDDLDCSAASSLANYLSTLPLYERVNTSIDLDVVRFRRGLNPILAGDYVLNLRASDKQLTAVGFDRVVGASVAHDEVVQAAESSVVKLAFTPRTKAEGYEWDTAGCASDSWVWVYSGEMRLDKVGVAAWNATQLNLPSGAVIFPHFDGLNREGLELYQREIVEVAGFIE
ncbi:MAG: capsule biosynthesis GfcC D2 domain-containing protein [Pseudomonadales bacterium]|jgi:hypothetical protein